MSLELIEILGPAFVVGLLIAATHAPLGISVLQRGIIFIDLAVAQIAGLGLIIATTYFHEPAWWMLQSIALGFALFAGLFFSWVERSAPAQLEAIIGTSFVVSGALVLLLLADHPHGGEAVQHLLSGQILFVTWSDVFTHAPVYVLIVALWFYVPSVRNGITFYALFALAITSSVQLVGVYVVFASLILPALAAVKRNRPHQTAWLCGALAVVTGILISAITDLPTGPLLVVTYLAACLALKCGPKLFPT